MRPRLLLIEEEARERLRTMALLTPTYEVLSPAPGEDPLKAARRLVPELVLIDLHRYRPIASLQLCRMLKTDLAPIRAVGIRAPDAWPPAEEVMERWMADGYLGGGQLEELLPFLAALAQGQRPVVPGKPPKGLRHRLRRWLARS